ncbi:FG-GAP-like repeat-containing protein [Actinomycetaceae bacterium MB13-C1-2]|nr:FG-GAP-like repeat-containing protein [Actinomycetaceae bacterium MB13-C1-2]
MATRLIRTSKSYLAAFGATVVVSVLALGSVFLIAPGAQAVGSPSSIGSEGATSFFTGEIPALFVNEVDPVVDNPEATEVEFADAVISESYTETGPVAEEVGNEQQVEAVQQAGKDGSDESVLQGIARIDLDADVAVVGATWDIDSPTPEIIAWRSLSNGVWSEWGNLEAESNEESGEVLAGTEVLILANTDAVEVVAITAEGTPVPGLALQVVNAEYFAPADNALLDIYPDEEAQSGEEATGDQPQKEGTEGQSGEVDEELEETGYTEDVALDKKDLAQADGVSLRSSSVPNSLSSLSTSGLNAGGTIYDTGYDGLKIGTRKQWCTGPSCDVDEWTTNKVQGAVVHHTESSKDGYTKAQVPQLIQNIQYYHAVTRGWGDIGYNLIVDAYGGVWEGRVGSLTNQVQGAHAYGANYETFGIAMLGSYTKVAPPTVARQAMSKAIAWKLNQVGVKSATTKIQVPGAWNLEAGSAAKISVPAVSAHRDVGPTDCPGDAFYAQMDTVRSEVDAHLARMNISRAEPMGGTIGQPSPISWNGPVQIGNGWFSRVVFPGDWDGNGYPDMILIDDAGYMWLYPGLANERFGVRYRIGNGWNNVEWVQGGVDWNGDGNVDIIARMKSDNSLRLYPGNGRGGFLPSRQIGNGWGGMSHILLTETATGPGIYAVTAGESRMYFYPGDGFGGFRSPNRLGTGWGAMSALVAVGDWTGDGVPDMLARDRDGLLYLYAGLSDGTPGIRTLVGNGWNSMANMSGSDKGTLNAPLWAVRQDGALMSYGVNGGTSNALGIAVANAAKKQVGVAVGECTWVISRALEAAGISVPWYAGTVAEPYLQVGAKQVTGEWQAGDILIWPGEHAAIYIGNGQAVHGGWSTGKTTVITTTKVFVGGSKVAREPSTVVRFS